MSEPDQIMINGVPHYWTGEEWKPDPFASMSEVNCYCDFCGAELDQYPDCCPAAKADWLEGLYEDTVGADFEEEVRGMRD